MKKGDIDYAWLYGLHRQGVWFVTRLKTNACYEVLEDWEIKAFYGTSKNTVLIQIWTALIAYLLLILIKLRSTVGWGLLELTRLLQTRLMERSSLRKALCPREKAPPPQMFLFNVGAGI